MNFSFKTPLDDETTRIVDTLSTLWLSLGLIVLVFSLLMAVFGASLSQAFMMINTLQLLSHIPLIARKLPPNAHLFLLNILNIVRLNVPSLTATTDTVLSKMREA